MKYWKAINCLAMCCLSVLMLSCTTENAVVGNVGISDVKSSGCKASASLMESRPDYYNHFIGQRSVLHLLLGKENTVRHVLQTSWITVQSTCSMLQQAAVRVR